MAKEFNAKHAKAADKVRALAHKAYHQGQAPFARIRDKTLRIAELIDDGKLRQARRTFERNDMWLPVSVQRLLYPDIRKSPEWVPDPAERDDNV